METAGAILQSQRLRRKLTFTQVAQLTKIPVKTLKAIEKNRFSQLPGPTYSKGFIKNYAMSLNLDPEPILAAWRRDYDKAKAKTILPAGLGKPLNPSGVPLHLRTWLSLSLVVVVMAAYLTWAIWQLYQPPTLTVLEPVEAATLTSPIKVSGKTDHDATLTLNGKTINLEPDGSFTTVYQANPGTNTLSLQATSRRGKTTAIIRHVIIEE